MFVVLVSSDRCTYAKAGSPGTASRRRLDVPLDSAADINLNGLTLDESPHDKYQGTSNASSGDIRHFLIPLRTVAHMYHCIYPSLVLVSAQLPSNCIPMSLESSLT